MVVCVWVTLDSRAEGDTIRYVPNAVKSSGRLEQWQGNITFVIYQAGNSLSGTLDYSWNINTGFLASSPFLIEIDPFGNNPLTGAPASPVLLTGSISGTSIVLSDAKDGVTFTGKVSGTSIAATSKVRDPSSLGFNSRHFTADRELLSGVRRAVNMGQVKEEIRDYLMDPDNRGWLRKVANIRISSQRLKRLAKRYLPEPGSNPSRERYGGRPEPKQRPKNGNARLGWLDLTPNLDTKRSAR